MNISIVYLIINWLIIFILVFFTEKYFYLYPIVLPLISSRQFANYLLGHDGIHGLITPNKFINVFISRFFCLFPVFVSFQSYQTNHNAHHEFLGTDLDPDKALFKAYPLSIKDFAKSMLKYFFSLRMLFDFISYFTPFYIIWRSKKWIKLLELENLLFMLFHFVVIFNVWYFKFWKEYLMYWLLPILIMIPYYYFVSAFQHGGIYEATSPKNSRNIIGNKWLLELLLPCNTNYHAVHHEYPQVAFYNLPKVFRKKKLNGESLQDAIRFLFGLKNDS